MSDQIMLWDLQMLMDNWTPCKHGTISWSLHTLLFDIEWKINLLEIIVFMIAIYITL